MAQVLEAVDGEEERSGDLNSAHGLKAVHGEEEGGGFQAAGALKDVHGEEEMALQNPLRLGPSSATGDGDDGSVASRAKRKNSLCQ